MVPGHPRALQTLVIRSKRVHLTPGAGGRCVDRTILMCQLCLLFQFSYFNLFMENLSLFFAYCAEVGVNFLQSIPSRNQFSLFDRCSSKRRAVAGLAYRLVLALQGRMEAFYLRIIFKTAFCLIPSSRLEFRERERERVRVQVQQFLNRTTTGKPTMTLV